MPLWSEEGGIVSRIYTCTSASYTVSSFFPLPLPSLEEGARSSFTYILLLRIHVYYHFHLLSSLAFFLPHNSSPLLPLSHLPLPISPLPPSLPHSSFLLYLPRPPSPPPSSFTSPLPHLPPSHSSSAATCTVDVGSTGDDPWLSSWTGIPHPD